MPKPLAHRTLDPISHDCVPHLAAHRNPQSPHGDSLRTPTYPPTSLSPRRSNQHHELARCQPPPQPCDAHEISAGPESLPALQATSLAHCTTLLGPDSRSCSLPALCTPPLDNRLSPAGLHSPPEPVLPQPLDPTGLIGSLHLLLPTFPLPTFTKALSGDPLPTSPHLRRAPTADPRRNLTHSTKLCTEDAVDRTDGAQRCRSIRILSPLSTPQFLFRGRTVAVLSGTMGQNAALCPWGTRKSPFYPPCKHGGDSGKNPYPALT